MCIRDRLVGLALASGRTSLSPAVAGATLAAALLIQIATNLANDYYDFRRGADDENRLGPARAAAAGLLDPSSVFAGFVACLAAAAVLGIGLVAHGGWPILAIGVVSLALAWAYTGGPYPLAYHGLGDPFVLVFFGVVPVAGTYFLQTGRFDAVAWLAGVPAGLLAVAILVVNNLRDRDTDARSGKRTLAVRIGDAATRAEYRIAVGGAYAALLPLAWLEGAAVLLPLLTAPLAVGEVGRLNLRDGRDLNLSLAGTTKVHALFGALMAAGLLLA